MWLTIHLFLSEINFRFQHHWCSVKGDIFGCSLSLWRRVWDNLCCSLPSSRRAWATDENDIIVVCCFWGLHLYIMLFYIAYCLQVLSGVIFLHGCWSSSWLNRRSHSWLHKCAGFWGCHGGCRWCSCCWGWRKCLHIIIIFLHIIEIFIFYKILNFTIIKHTHRSVTHCFICIQWLFLAISSVLQQMQLPVCNTCIEKATHDYNINHIRKKVGLKFTSPGSLGISSGTAHSDSEPNTWSLENESWRFHVHNFFFFFLNQEVELILKWVESSLISNQYQNILNFTYKLFQFNQSF